MSQKYRPYYSVLAVALAHVVALAAVIYARAPSQPVVIEPPTIQGMLVSSEPPIEPKATLPPPPQQQPVATPKAPLLKAAAVSEQAIHQETQPEPAPAIEPQKTTEPAQAAVTPPQSDATHLNNPKPEYPSQSRRMREQGTVVLEVLVTADGSLGEVRLKTSSGSKRLDDAALRAVKSWHFVPAKRGGEAIDFWYELPIEFSLNN